LYSPKLKKLPGAGGEGGDLWAANFRLALACDYLFPSLPCADTKTGPKAETYGYING